MVIVGIGIIPAVQPLIAAGAEGGNGVASMRSAAPACPISCDRRLRAPHQSLCRRRAHPAGIGPERQRSGDDRRQAHHRQPDDYHAIPWFWSNQYDLRLQTVGLSIGFDEAIVRGDPGARSFSVVYLKQGRVIALDCVNATKDYVQGRALVTGGLEDLADDEIADVLALALVGRGTYDASEWDEALEAASEDDSERMIEQLLDMPMLAGYLEAGLTAFDLSCDGVGQID
jgi:3-phenylpropionate/trans-cinnamate dioxygenase ferredoxin reductase subunit